MICEELAKVCAATSCIYSAHVGLCCWPIYNWGTEEQKQKFLKPLCEGKKLGAFALTEPSAGTDAAMQKSFAEKQPDGSYILNGSKVFITNGGYADVVVVFAMSIKGIGTKGITAFILEKGMPGFTVGKSENKMGIRGSSTCELFFDNVDIMKLPFKKVRDSIGYVPQDNFLFSDTISNNISFAYTDLDEEKIERAAKLSDVHDNIIDFKDQYKTILGERGVTLSGGQKQRVSIARALVKDPQILILDDSVSAVDTKTEEEILRNLREIRKGKTTIIIAHRISTVKDLDKIVVLDNGTISGVGSHDELLLNNKEYQDLVRLQSLEREVEGGEIDGE
jgi:ABC-type proline/glycine betaine transport system ATPase subunit